jgi:thioredoxin-like negative regulator of GroEL
LFSFFFFSLFDAQVIPSLHLSRHRFLRFLLFRRRGMKTVLAQEADDDAAAATASSTGINPGAIEVTPTEFRAKLAQMSSSEKYFAKFYAPWCGHCKSMAADWDALAKEETEVKLFSVDASVQSEAAVSQEFEIKSFPTIMFFEDGKMFPYSGGARTKDALGTFARSKAKKDARTFSFKGESFKLQQPGMHVRAKKYWEESVQVIKQVYKHKPGAAYVLYGAGLLTGVCFASLFFAVTQKGGGKKAASTKTAAAAKSKGSAKKTN